jgi:hypothetical protein
VVDKERVELVLIVGSAVAEAVGEGVGEGERVGERVGEREGVGVDVGVAEREGVVEGEATEITMDALTLPRLEFARCTLRRLAWSVAFMLPAPQRGRDAAALRPMLPLTPPPAVALLTVFAALLIFKDRGVLTALSLRPAPTAPGAETLVLTEATVGSVAAAPEVATDTLTEGALLVARTTGAVGVEETGHSATQPCPAKLAAAAAEREAGSRA